MPLLQGGGHRKTKLGSRQAYALREVLSTTLRRRQGAWRQLYLQGNIERHLSDLHRESKGAREEQVLAGLMTNQVWWFFLPL